MEYLLFRTMPTTTTRRSHKAKSRRTCLDLDWSQPSSLKDYSLIGFADRTDGRTGTEGTKVLQRRPQLPDLLGRRSPPKSTSYTLAPLNWVLIRCLRDSCTVTISYFEHQLNYLSLHDSVSKIGFSSTTKWRHSDLSISKSITAIWIRME